MANLELGNQENFRRASSYRAAAAAVCVLGLAAVVFFKVGPGGSDHVALHALANVPAATAPEAEDYLHTLARDPSVPRAQDVFAAKEAAADEPQPPTF